MRGGIFEIPANFITSVAPKNRCSTTLFPSWGLPSFSLFRLRASFFFISSLHFLLHAAFHTTTVVHSTLTHDHHNRSSTQSLLRATVRRSKILFPAANVGAPLTKPLSALFELHATVGPPLGSSVHR